MQLRILRAQTPWHQSGSPTYPRILQDGPLRLELRAWASYNRAAVPLSSAGAPACPVYLCLTAGLAGIPGTGASSKLTAARVSRCVHAQAAMGCLGAWDSMIW